MNKIKNIVMAFNLIALFTYAALATGEGAQDRALQIRIENCEKAIAKYRSTKQETDRADAERLCKHSTHEAKNTKNNAQAKPQKNKLAENKPESSSISVWMIVLGALIALAMLKKKKTKRWNNPRTTQNLNRTFNRQSTEKITYTPKDHLSITLSHKYEKKRLLNKSEENVFNTLLRILLTNAKGEFKIAMQPSLGEILQCEEEGHKTINSKRVDFCIVDKQFMPVAVIEVNGSGHYQGNALERDEVKRAAIESAGIKYIAVRENENIHEKLYRELSVFFKPTIERIIN